MTDGNWKCDIKKLLVSEYPFKSVTNEQLQHTSQIYDLLIPPLFREFLHCFVRCSIRSFWICIKPPSLVSLLHFHIDFCHCSSASSNRRGPNGKSTISEKIPSTDLLCMTLCQRARRKKMGEHKWNTLVIIECDESNSLNKHFGNLVCIIFLFEMLQDSLYSRCRALCSLVVFAVFNIYWFFVQNFIVLWFYNT